MPCTGSEMPNMQPYSATSSVFLRLLISYAAMVKGINPPRKPRIDLGEGCVGLWELTLVLLCGLQAGIPPHGLPHHAVDPVCSHQHVPAEGVAVCGRHRHPCVRHVDLCHPLADQDLFLLLQVAVNELVPFTSLPICYGVCVSARTK